MSESNKGGPPQKSEALLMVEALGKMAIHRGRTTTVGTRHAEISEHRGPDIIEQPKPRTAETGPTPFRESYHLKHK